MSRLIWAIVNIIVFTYGLELLHDADDPTLSALLLFFLFVFCETLPMMFMLDYSYIQIISFERNPQQDQQQQQQQNRNSGIDSSSNDEDDLNAIMNIEGYHHHHHQQQSDGSENLLNNRLGNETQQIAEDSWLDSNKRPSLFFTAIQEESEVDGEDDFSEPSIL